MNGLILFMRVLCFISINLNFSYYCIIIVFYDRVTARPCVSVEVEGDAEFLSVSASVQYIAVILDIIYTVESLHVVTLLEEGRGRTGVVRVADSVGGGDRTEQITAVISNNSGAQSVF